MAGGIFTTQGEWWLVQGCLLAVTAVVFFLARETASYPAEKAPSGFRKFQINYLLVYLIMSAADWFQGPYVYSLYETCYYDMDTIGVFFIVGFGSSAVFGTIAGSVADKYGRKKLGIAYGIIYTASCATKHSCDFWILLLGRVTGGIATSLLFSVFETWLVYQHRIEGYKEELLAQTFSLAVFLNAVVAIFSGIIANSIVTKYTVVQAFDASAGLLFLGTLTLIFTWSENYGDSERPMMIQFKETLSLMWNDKAIFRVGVAQSMFEASMYIFVFMWTPLLEEVLHMDDPHQILGQIFACFMTTWMIGSTLYKLFIKYRISNRKIAIGTFTVSSLILLAPAISPTLWPSFFCCLIFEVCVGVYFPVIGIMRSEYIPEESRATFYNLFRIPLNLIVCVVLLKASFVSFRIVFYLCAGFCATALWAVLSLGKFSNEYGVIQTVEEKQPILTNSKKVSTIA
eukprot:GFYU01003440.1.p1 GENE.GFYU01003440.1~~GFYU01003440.1.p1  ORF type:complete len:457 (-),score=117.69 GFYU01003440.1:191-1561(-)